MLRLYLDEDAMDRDLVAALRARGVDVVTAHEAGMDGREDADHLSYATAQGRVICTFNVGHFARLHAEWLRRGTSHAGIVVVTQQQYQVGELIRRLLKLASGLTEEEMRDRIEYLSNWSPNR